MAYSKIFAVTSDGNITLPSDWNNADNKCEGVGPGGAGGAGLSARGAPGGGSGAYTFVVNANLGMAGQTCAVTMAATEDTTLADHSGTNVLTVKQGIDGTSTTPGTGGQAASCVPSAGAFSGASGGARPGVGVTGGSGGAGAAGPTGAGNAGVLATTGTGGAGGRADDAVGAAGGAADNNGVAGTTWTTNTTVTGGAATGTYGPAGGGGGGSTASPGQPTGAPNYGAGGGGGGSTSQPGGVASGGLLVISYNPASVTETRPGAEVVQLGPVSKFGSFGRAEQIGAFFQWLPTFLQRRIPLLSSIPHWFSRLTLGY